MICKMCQKEFIQKHHSQKLCSNECKSLSLKQTKRRWKKSPKGIEAYKRWNKSPTKKALDKRYSQTDKAKEKAKLRVRRYRKEHPQTKEKIREYNIKYEKTEKARKRNRLAVSRYSKTEAGRWKQKLYKYKLRNNKSGPIDKYQWNEKLKELGGKCQMCGTTENITIDHIIPLSKGGTNDIKNLQPLCRSCNCKKSNKL